MKKGVVGKLDVLEENLDKTSKKILDELRDGDLSKKEIANKNGVTLAIVQRIAKNFNVGTVVKEKSKKKEKEKMKKEQKIEKEVQNSITTKSTKPISEDLILRILELREEQYSYRQIAKELGISEATAFRYCKKFDMTESYKKKKGKVSSSIAEKKKSQKESKYSESSDDKKESLSFDNTRIIKVGLIRNRHIMPVDNFIFDSIPDDMIFDFDWMDKTVKDFILSNINFINIKDGVIIPDKKLYVYVTGLSSALASVIKICSELCINLTLFHFDTKSGTFIPQVIFEAFKQSKNRLVGNIFKNNGKVVFTDCSFNDIFDSEFYLIEMVNFDSENKNDRQRDMYIVKDYSNLWRFYGELSEQILSIETKRITLFAYICKIENDILRKGKRMSKTSNFYLKD